MEEEQNQISYELALKLRDLEMGQKLMRERVLLIGQNFIDWQEKLNDEVTEIKKELQNLRTNTERIKTTINSLSEEVAKSARKEEVAMIRRQFKMFEPLKNKKTEDIENLIEEKINKYKNLSKEDSFWTGKV